VVELVTAYMLDVLRPRVFLDRPLGKQEWNAARKELIGARQLCDLSLGIIGLGRVGSGVARVGIAMDMRVRYHDLVVIPEDRRFGAEPAGLEQLLRESDVISVHVDGRAENRNLINSHALGMCRPNVLLMNTSRGFVVDTSALAAFLKLHHGATAVLDVHEPEPFGAGYPLLGLPNAHLTPHIGAATASAHANMSWVVKDLWRVLSGEAPEFPARP
jgi:phosphoglycerate dehydrogenase-like enzyme